MDAWHSLAAASVAAGRARAHLQGKPVQRYPRAGGRSGMEIHRARNLARMELSLIAQDAPTAQRIRMMKHLMAAGLAGPSRAGWEDARHAINCRDLIVQREDLLAAARRLSWGRLALDVGVRLAPDLVELTGRQVTGYDYLGAWADEVEEAEGILLGLQRDVRSDLQAGLSEADRRCNQELYLKLERMLHRFGCRRSELRAERTRFALLRQDSGVATDAIVTPGALGGIVLPVSLCGVPLSASRLLTASRTTGRPCEGAPQHLAQRGRRADRRNRARHVPGWRARGRPAPVHRRVPLAVVVAAISSGADA